MTATFKEPKLINLDLSSDNNEVYKLIRYYYEECNLETLLKYFKEYLILSDKSDLKVPSTYHPCLIMARLVTRKVTLSDDYLSRLDNYVNSLPVQAKALASPAISKPVNKVICYEHLNNLDYLIDSKLYNKVFTYPVETQVTKIKDCIDYIQSFLETLEVDFKHKDLLKDQYTLLKRDMTSLLNNYVISLTASKVSTKPVNKKAMTKAVNYSTTLTLNTKKFLYPHEVVGKKKLFVLDVKKKTLICFISSSSFVFTGTTLKNILFDKSWALKLKTVDVVTNSLSELNQLKASGLYRDVEVTHGRFNSEILLVAAS